MKSKKELYVHGIVKDYDESINSINKYLFSENERLNAIIDELEERIDKAIEYIKDNFDKTGICVSGSDLPYSYIEELLKILGDKE